MVGSGWRWSQGMWRDMVVVVITVENFAIDGRVTL